LPSPADVEISLKFFGADYFSFFEVQAPPKKEG
jgi:hypothetical protein